MLRKKIHNYTIFMDKKIGEGSFGKVYLAQQDKTHLKVAAKMLDKKFIDSDKYIKQALFSEIQILKILKSENIVGFLDVMESTNFYYVIQQFCDEGDLRGLMNKKGKFSQKEAIEILKQFCNGFVQILKEGIIHRDLKPENLLINKGTIKICDFGFSKKIHSQKVKHLSIVGTPLYMSLEILKGQPYTSKCDIWALGFIFYELLNGVTPWTAATQFELINNIEKIPLTFLVQLSKNAKDFLSKCLKIWEKDRISWDELLRHAIFDGYFDKYIELEHKFENRLKSLMTEIRMIINQQNIDLQKLFENIGYNKMTQLNFENFKQFMKTIDSSLTPQQERYIFEKLDVNGTDSISFEEFEKVLIKNNVPMKSKIQRYQKKTSTTQNASSTESSSSTETKVINSFLKLAQKMHKNKITFQQVFNAYDVNRSGDLTIKEFSRIMKKLDDTLSVEEIKETFDFIDVNRHGSITYQEFYKYFCVSTGEPYRNYMTTLKIQKKESDSQKISVHSDTVINSNDNKKTDMGNGSSKKP